MLIRIQIGNGAERPVEFKYPSGKKVAEGELEESGKLRGQHGAPDSGKKKLWKPGKENHRAAGAESAHVPAAGAQGDSRP